MIVRTKEATQQALLLQTLAEGEQLAHDCALGQVRLTTSIIQRRFFLAQARQEAIHRRIFGGVILWLAGRGVRGVRERLRERATLYLAFSDKLLAAHESRFEFFDEDPQTYQRVARPKLPAWPVGV